MVQVALAVIYAAMLLAAPFAHAAVIELEGTVKSVDPDARTISIERKTAKGTKTMDLEVNKKAGDLSTVKVGDKISFSYDPGLEVVTKIGPDGDADKASGTDADEAIAKALKELQGEWLMTAGEENGQSFERSDVKRQNRRVHINGKTLTMERVKGNVAKWTGKFTIDPETKAFDWVGTNSQRSLHPPTVRDRSIRSVSWSFDQTRTGRGSVSRSGRGQELASREGGP